jgi:3-deoxy-D-manno-octulosonic-acid transferase
MNPLYNLGINIYAAVAALAALRSQKVSKMLTGQRLTLDNLRAERLSKATQGYDYWFHAASLGEFEQARPMIERLRDEQPAVKILLTFFSPSGYEVRKNYDKVDTVAYLPFDKPADVEKFLDAAHPRMAIFVKYEFWGNYLSQLKRRNIPTYIISAIFRPKQIFFRPWGGMFRNMLSCFTHLYVQDDASRNLLNKIGVTNVTVAGDTRFDRVTQIMRNTVDLPAIETFKSRAEGKCLFIAGSSWGADEDIYAQWLIEHKDVCAIIAPHEFNPQRLAALMQRFGSDVALYSEYRPEQDTAVRILIIDCFGLLSSLYRYGDFAYIGGGFGAGLHNINEAAVYDMPVVFGPNNYKFKEAHDLSQNGGGFEVTDKASFNRVADTLLNDNDARRKAGDIAGKYIQDHIGATDIIYNDIIVNP